MNKSLLVDPMHYVVVINYHGFSKQFSIIFNSCHLIILDLSVGSTKEINTFLHCLVSILYLILIYNTEFNNNPPILIITIKVWSFFQHFKGTHRVKEVHVILQQVTFWSAEKVDLLQHRRVELKEKRWLFILAGPSLIDFEVFKICVMFGEGFFQF